MSTFTLEQLEAIRDKALFSKPILNEEPSNKIINAPPGYFKKPEIVSKDSDDYFISIKKNLKLQR